MGFDKHSSFMTYEAVYTGIDNVSGNVADAKVQNGADRVEWNILPLSYTCYGVVLRPHGMEQNLETMVCSQQTIDVRAV